jgi:hypothetical protein
METGNNPPNTMPTPKPKPSTNAPPVPPLMIGQNPCLVTEGFKTFHELTADKCTMLINAIETLLDEPGNVICADSGDDRQSKKSNVKSAIQTL